MRRRAKPSRRRNVLLLGSVALVFSGYLIGSILASSFCNPKDILNERDVVTVLRGNQAFEQLQQERKKNETKIIMAGLIKSGHAIRMEPLTLFVQMACLYGAQSHIIVHNNPDALRTLFQSLARDLYPDNMNCGTKLLHIEEQAVKRGKRIEKMSEIREQQRTSLKKLLLSNVLDDTVIILVDLDLLSCPPASKVYHYATSMIADGRNNGVGSGISSYDVLCAGGVLTNKEGEGYYDSFATVFVEGDTFNHPLKLRFNHSLREEENEELVFNFENNTSVEILQLMKDKSKPVSPYDDFRPVPVQSCFGGMALYKSSAYFTPICSYVRKKKPDKSMLKYDRMTLKYGNHYGEICEHTIFHMCLHNGAHKTLGINLNLRTQWSPNEKKIKGDDLAASKFQIPIPDPPTKHPHWRVGLMK